MLPEDAPACVPAPAGGADGPPRRPAPGLVPPLDVEVEPLPAEELEEGVRVTFWVNVRDARGDRCPDLAVEVRIRGPERTGEGMAWTDRYGQAQFRMTGPRGSYRCEILDVAGRALEVSHRESETVVATAEVTV